MEDFTDERVLIIGGSSGIGRATAEAFAKAGAHVTIAARSPERLAKAAQDIERETGQRVSASELDTQSDEWVDGWFLDAPPWNHVVVTGAKTKTGPTRQLQLDQAHDAMQSKFWGAYHVGRHADIVPGGSLTLVSGYLASRPSKQSVLQSAINAAVDALARGLALELSPVRVNSVSPGLIDTPLWDILSAEERASMFEQVARRLPAQRYGTASDVARAIIYLAGNPYATGTTVVVDGGATLA
jgi:NAD(P)-dependent dehydrogenase (short-subunit alcohol dehydrogenase family)